MIIASLFLLIFSFPLCAAQLLSAHQRSLERLPHFATEMSTPLNSSEQADRKPLDPNTEEEWWEALEKSNTAKVKAIYTEFLIDVNKANEEGNTPLHITAHNLDAATCQFLVESAKADARIGNYGSTPLHIAEKKGDEKLARILIKAQIERGYYLKREDNRGKTLFYYAFAHKLELPILKNMMKKDVDVNQQSSCGHTALHLILTPTSLAERQAGTINTLVVAAWLRITMGAQDKIIPSVICDIVLGYCTYTQWMLDAIKALLEKGADVNKKGPFNRTPLCTAATYGHTKICKYLIEIAKADVTIADEEGNTPLYSAAYGRYTAICKILVEGGANVNQANEYGWTPLYIAAEKGYTATCQYLVNDAKADVTIADKRGWTPLLAAASNGHTSTCQYLVNDAKADVNRALVNSRKTPLHLAAWNGHTETCVLLVEQCKANVNQVDQNGKTALDLAQEKGHTAIVAFLQGRT